MKKRDLTALEKELLKPVDKYLPVIIVIVVTIMSLFLRKIAIWWNYSEIISGFDRHVGHVESAFRYAMVFWAEHLPFLPVHTVKWMSGLADFGLAALVTLLLRRKDKTKNALLYTVFLFSPVLYLRGIIWAQPDSPGMVFLLLAFWLSQKHTVCTAPSGSRLSLSGCACVCFAAVGCALAPVLLPVMLLFLLFRRETGNRRMLCYQTIAAFFLTWLLQLFSLLLLDGKWELSESILCCVRYLYTDPVTGAGFSSVSDGLTGLARAIAFPASVISFIRAGRKPTGRKIALACAIQIAAAILYSSFLFS